MKSDPYIRSSLRPEIIGTRVEQHFEEIQGRHIFFFTLLVMLWNYETTIIVTIKMVIVFIVEAGELESIKIRSNLKMKNVTIYIFIIFLYYLLLIY